MNCKLGKILKIWQVRHIPNAVLIFSFEDGSVIKMVKVKVTIKIMTLPCILVRALDMLVMAKGKFLMVCIWLRYLQGR